VYQCHFFSYVQKDLEFEENKVVN